jgi:uncharacterized protein (TIGR02271 family)
MTQDSGRHAGDPLPDERTQQFDPLTDDRTQHFQPAHGEHAQHAEAAEVTLHEERAHTGTELTEAGRVRVRKHVETYPVTETVPRNVEYADASERVPAVEGDSGEVETLEDGSISIPVFEEVLVVTKRLVVRERVIVRKKTVVDEYTLQTELQREHVTVDGDIEVPDADNGTNNGIDGGIDRSHRSDEQPL